MLASYEHIGKREGWVEYMIAIFGENLFWEFLRQKVNLEAQYEPEVEHETEDSRV